MAIISDKKAIETHLKSGINRLVNLLISIVNKECSGAELCYFIASLNFMYVDEVKGNPEKDNFLLRQNLSDVYKYLISLLASVKNLPLEFEKVSEIDKIAGLVDGVRGINDKFQAINALNFYSKVFLDTETNQVSVHIDELSSNQFINKLNLYGIRVQENLNKELELKSFENALNDVLSDFIDFDDLVKIAFDISIGEIKEIIIGLKAELDIRYTYEYDNFTFKSKDIIDSKNYNNHILYTSLLIFSKEQLLKIHPKACKFVGLFTFIPDEFDPFELRYNYIDKKSIILIRDFYFISLELLINSLHAGLHYSLLDSMHVGEKYKKRESSLFEQKISDIAKKYGFETIERNVDLYERKRKLGDIDLLIKNSEQQKIYIEAKSYSLHSNIQAHDPVEMQKQLKIQQTKWESKVLARKQHIEKQTENKSIVYIIVTRKPEILSHFSELLVLNIQEFEFWLKNIRKDKFESIYDELYGGDRQISDKILREISPNWDSK